MRTNRAPGSWVHRMRPSPARAPAGPGNGARSPGSTEEAPARGAARRRRPAQYPANASVVSDFAFANAGASAEINRGGPET